MKSSFTILLTIMCSIAAAYHPHKWKHAYVGQYSISYPESWGIEIGKDEIDSMLFNPYSPASGPEDIFRENVSVSKHDWRKIEDLNKDAEETIAYLKSVIPEFSLIESQVFPVGKFQKCYTLTYSGLMNNIKWRHYTRVIYGEDFFYNLMMTSPDEDFELFISDTKKIFDSFRIVKAADAKEK
jgi:hypothetical protein